MPAPGAFILLAAVSASGCLASPAHPGESGGPSGGAAAPIPPTRAAQGSPVGLGPHHLCACLPAAAPGPGGPRGRSPCPQGLWEAGRGLGGERVRSGNMCLHTRVCVCRCVRAAAGRAGPRGGECLFLRQPQRGQLSAASGRPGAGRAPFSGAWAGDGGHVCAPSAPKGDMPRPC